MQSNRQFNQQYFRKLPLGLLVLLALFIGSLFVFFYITNHVLWRNNHAIDNAILGYVGEHIVHAKFTGFMKAVTWCASSLFMQIAYGLLVVNYLMRKKYRRSAEILAVGVGGYLVNYFMKNSFQRVRPTDPLIDPLHNFSFPSGHATSAFIFYGLLIYLIWKTRINHTTKYLAASLLFGFALLIGFSRVYLRVHFPSDVFAGFCIGLAWLLLSVGLMERLKKKTGEQNLQS